MDFRKNPQVMYTTRVIFYKPIGFSWVIFRENACCKSMDFKKKSTNHAYKTGDILKTIGFFMGVVIKPDTFPFTDSIRRQFDPKSYPWISITNKATDSPS